MSKKTIHKDDGGLTWRQVVSLAETGLERLNSLWARSRPLQDEDMEDLRLGDYLEAERHLHNLVKRARVMLEREAGGDG